MSIIRRCFLTGSGPGSGVQGLGTYGIVVVLEGQKCHGSKRWHKNRSLLMSSFFLQLKHRNIWKVRIRNNPIWRLLLHGRIFSSSTCWQKCLYYMQVNNCWYKSFTTISIVLFLFCVLVTWLADRLDAACTCWFDLHFPFPKWKILFWI